MQKFGNFPDNLKNDKDQYVVMNKGDNEDDYGEEYDDEEEGEEEGGQG